MFGSTQGGWAFPRNGSPRANSGAPLIQRLVAKVRVAGRDLDCHLLVSDIADGVIKIFCSETIAPGTSVDVLLPFENRLVLHGVVVERLAPLRRGHIVARTAFNHRIVVQFHLQSAEERALLHCYVTELRRNFGGMAASA